MMGNGVVAGCVGVAYVPTDRGRAAGVAEYPSGTPPVVADAG